jgi:hypothetical protein
MAEHSGIRFVLHFRFFDFFCDFLIALCAPPCRANQSIAAHEQVPTAQGHPRPLPGHRWREAQIHRTDYFTSLLQILFSILFDLFTILIHSSLFI